jgi:hypothetical protein
MGREISTSVERAAMNAIQIAAFGNAAEVVKAVDIPDVGAAGALADMTDVVYGIHSAGCVRRWTCDLGLIETPDFVCLPPNFYANELQRIRRPSWGSKPRVLWKRTVH